MNTTHCAEQLDRIYSRLAWIMLLMGTLFAYKALLPLLPLSWTSIEAELTSVMVFCTSVLMIWTLLPSVLKKVKNGRPLEPEPDGFAAQMIHQALAISWGMTIGGLVLLQVISKVLFEVQPDGQLVLNGAFALMFVSASLSFLYLVHDGYDVPEQQDWD